jgi:hypothetical protein
MGNKQGWRGHAMDPEWEAGRSKVEALRGIDGW